MTILARAWDAITSAFVPRLPLTIASASLTSEPIARAEYDPEHAMSALAAYPWARVAILAVATDMSSRPIALYNRKTRRRVEQHWLLDVLRRPDPEWSGLRWRRQIDTDYLAAGYCFARLYRSPLGTIVRMERIHPARVERYEDQETGQYLGWILDGITHLQPGECFVVSQPSWRKGANLQHIGESPIRALDLQIRGALGAVRQANTAASRGRHEMILTPEKDSPLGAKGAADLANAVERSAREGKAALVLSHGIAVHNVSSQMREGEYQQLQVGARDATLASFGVPPVRAQLPSANYGAAKQEMRQYWESTVKPHNDLFDAEFSELVWSEGLVAMSGYEDVEALQTSRTERLNRVTVWEQLGATPHRAAQFEGFMEPPLDVDAVARVDKPKIPSRPDLRTDTPQAQSLDADVRRATKLVSMCGGAYEVYDVVHTCLASHLSPVALDTVAMDVSSSWAEGGDWMAYLDTDYARRVTAALEDAA